MHFQALRAALQVFTDHATLSDYQVRAKLLSELCACSANISWAAHEISSSASRLTLYSDHLQELFASRGSVNFSE